MAMVVMRRRFKPSSVLQERLTAEAQRVLRARAKAIPVIERQRAIRKALALHTFPLAT